MTAVVNHTTVVNHYWIETLLFPLFIPVFVFRLLHLIGDDHLFHREIADDAIQNRLVEERLLYISLQELAFTLESLKAGISGHVSKQIGRILPAFGSSLDGKMNF